MTFAGKTGIREFRAHMAEYLEGVEPVILERRGKLIAIVLPVKPHWKHYKSEAEAIRAETRRRFEVALKRTWKL